MSARPSPTDPNNPGPPDDATVNAAMEDYVRAVRKEYGQRLRGIYLFGSRARGDHTHESDADIAVVLDDGDWDFWKEKMRLADLAYEMIVATGAHLQGWPVTFSDWVEPVACHDAVLICQMRRDARPIGSNS